MYFIRIFNSWKIDPYNRIQDNVLRACVKDLGHYNEPLKARDRDVCENLLHAWHA